MLTREELLNNIRISKSLLNNMINKYNEFNNYLNDNKISTGRKTYENIYDTIEYAHVASRPLIGTYASDIQTLKNKIAYYNDLLKVQYNGDLDHGISSLIEMFNDNIDAHKEMLRLYTIAYSLTIKNIEYATKLKVLTNTVYQRSYASSLQGSIVRQQSAALDAATADSPDMKEYLERLKDPSNYVWKGGKTRRRRNQFAENSKLNYFST